MLTTWWAIVLYGGVMMEEFIDESMFIVPENKEPHPFVRVLYEETKPETYRGIKIEMPNGEEHILNSGHFVKDYQRAVDEYAPFLKSSTVHSYMRDLMNS